MKAFLTLVLAALCVQAYLVPSIRLLTLSNPLNVSSAAVALLKHKPEVSFVQNIAGELFRAIKDAPKPSTDDLVDLNSAAKRKVLKLANLVNNSNVKSTSASKKAEKVKNHAHVAKALAKPLLNLVTEQVFYPARIVTRVVPELASTAKDGTVQFAKKISVKSKARKFASGDLNMETDTQQDPALNLLRYAQDTEAVEAMKLLSSFLEKLMGGAGNDTEDWDSDEEYYRVDLGSDSDGDSSDDDDCDEYSYYQSYGHKLNRTQSENGSNSTHKLGKHLQNGTNQLEWHFSSVVGNFSEHLISDKLSTGSFRFIDISALAVAISLMLL